MGKPRAARRQPVVLSSEDEDDARDSPPPLKRPKRGTLTSTLQNGADAGSNKTLRSMPRRAAPPKARSKATTKSPSQSPAKSKPIHKPITSFFSNVPPPSSSRCSYSPEKDAAVAPVEEVDDILDSSADERPVARPSALPLRKRARNAPVPTSEALPKGSQRFLKAANGTSSIPPPSQVVGLGNADTRPWTERFGPVSVEELAVHKKKVADVRSWLSDVFSGSKRKRLLLLKGPAGSGKTTTMSLLAKELGIETHEWKNPAGSYSSEGFLSVTAQFEDFVGRTGAFGSLAFDESRRTQTQQRPVSPVKQKQLILVEEFPYTFARASSAVQSFRTAVLSYLTASTPSASDIFTGKVDPSQPVTPIVMIISETLLSTNTAAADSFTAHRLLGPEILSHPGTSVIEFNPIAPTFMTKALELVVLKEARKTGRRRSVGPQVIQRLSELGDVRSAISSLEFLCIRGDQDGDWGSAITFSKKKASKDTPLTKMEQETLEMVTQRESTLGIFHAVGKVVYNKRLVEDSNGTPVPQPPHWFPERRRPKASEVQLDSLIDELGTDIQTFIAALHENYVLSCEGTDNEETMDAIDGCIESLSDADLLSPDRFSNSGFGRRNFQGTSTDSLRQDEMSFHACVRGLLYSLPSPVKRIHPPPGVMGMKGKAASKGSAYVMYYPTSLRIWRQQEELGDLLDMYISRIQQGQLFSAKTRISKPVGQAATGGVETWKRSSAFAAPEKPSATSGAGTKAETTDAAPVLLGSGGSARYEMLLERLPYLTRIMQKKSLPIPLSPATLRDLRKLTTFTGTTNFTEDPEDDADDDPLETEQWATDRPVTDTPRKKTRNVNFIVRKGADGEGLDMVVEKEVRGLVLSDDDIED